MRWWKEIRKLIRKPKKRRFTPQTTRRFPDWTGIVEVLELRSTGGNTPIYSVGGNHYFYGIPLGKFVTLYPGARVKVTVEVLDRGRSGQRLDAEESLN